MNIEDSVHLHWYWFSWKFTVYNVCPLSCISCMLKFVYVLMGHMAYCMNKLLTYLYSYVVCESALFQSCWNFLIMVYTFCHLSNILDTDILGWLGEAKVSCSFYHWGAQLILAYSRARPAVLAAGKGRGWMLLFLLFLHFLSFSGFYPIPLFHLLYYLFYLFSPFLCMTPQIDPQGWRVVNPKHNPDTDM